MGVFDGARNLYSIYELDNDSPEGYTFTELSFPRKPRDPAKAPKKPAASASAAAPKKGFILCSVHELLQSKSLWQASPSAKFPSAKFDSWTDGDKREPRKPRTWKVTVKLVSTVGLHLSAYCYSGCNGMAFPKLNARRDAVFD